MRGCGLRRNLIRTELYGQPRRAPSLKPSHEVGSVRESKILQRGGNKARLVALVAENDQPLAEVSLKEWVAVPGSGVDPPFNDVAWVEPRTGNHAVGLSLKFRTYVNEHRPLPHGVKGVGRLHPFKALTRHRQQIVDRHPNSHTNANTSTMRDGFQRPLRSAREARGRGRCDCCFRV